MAEILKEWLSDRLQRPIKWEPQDFGDMMKDGYIISSVLHSYHVINEEKMYLIRDTKSPLEIQANWKYIKEWLRDIDIQLSDTDLTNIKDGKGSTLLRLFYQLFLHLDNRDRTDFIKRERKMVTHLVEKMTHRFTVKKVDETEEQKVEQLSRPLLNEKHFIEWQRKKEEEVKSTYDFIKHRYNKILDKIDESNVKPHHGAIPKTLQNKEKRDMEHFALKYPCKFKNYTYDELLGMEEASAERRRTIVDTEWAKTYMNNLYTRMSKKSDSEEFQSQVRNAISTTLWDQTVGEEESQFDIDLGRKVMKLSQFEKQMCTKIMETKQQARNLMNNRINAEREYMQQRDHQFVQYLNHLKEQISLEQAEINFEKHRQEVLHRRLYDEKLKKKRQHYYEICYETMTALVDYANKFAYFTQLIGDDIPDHYIQEWKALFFRKQPIFEVFEPTEDLLKEQQNEEEIEAEVEEIVRLELDRQEALNDDEFTKYNKYLYPWSLDWLIPNFDPGSQDRKYEYLGNRVLGHVVYTLLEVKYPRPPPMPAADLPNFSSKAILRGLPDKTITVAMQILLNSHKIEVVRLEVAINYCLRSFKQDMIGIADIDVNYDKFAAVTHEEESKELIKSLKSDDELYTKSIEGTLAAAGLIGPSPPNTKQTQTPKVLPEEEFVLSVPAELGKYAYEALSFGDSLTDHLLSAILVEYIKSLKDIAGFVIINYPNSYREAAILESTFSGREPPPEEDLQNIDDIYLEETIIKHRKIEKDPFKEIRLSRLVDDPHKKKIDKPFESYFTCYIKLHETEDILQEYMIWYLDEDNSELIDRFYATIGINYSMYYEVIERNLLFQICKYIIGDLTMPLKSTDALFGEDVLNLLEIPTFEDKRGRSKVIKPEISRTLKPDKSMSKTKPEASFFKIPEGSVSKTKRNSKISKSSVELAVVQSNELKENTQEEDVIDLEGESEEQADKFYLIMDDTKILAGDEDWEYGEGNISENLGIAVATFWEEIEKTYIHDLKQLFFSIRLQMNCLIPYCRFIKDKMEQIITLPSFKQNMVSQFQKEYNEFEDDWRDVNLTKNEWHCRIKDLQNKLYNICDERKIFAENERQALIADNWAVEELTTMANSYISCMQAEVNRSVLTFQILHDFYFIMLNAMPSRDRPAPRELMKIARDSENASGGAGKNKGTEDKVFKHLKQTYKQLILLNMELDFNNNPFNMLIENNVQHAQKIVKDINDAYRSVISKEYAEAKAKAVPAAAVIKKSIDTSSQAFDEIDPSKMALKCIEEWNMGINGEMYRADLRMRALHHKCHRDMKLFSDHIFKSFMDIQNSINTYYLNEIKSVDRLCKYLQLAVENGEKIQDKLILENDTFVIDPNLLQFPPHKSPQTISELMEYARDSEFKIGQLARLKSQFKIVAPTGLASLQAFIYLVQDLIFFGKESSEGPIVPELWKRIDPEQVPKLVYLLFGETAYVDWRDFFIYCLNIRFPTVDELLNLRHNLRCKDPNSTELVTRDDFLNEQLWFEYDCDPYDPYLQLRKNLMKHFIFELFETSPDLMNYSAFLLAFCKSPNPIHGFTSALSMAVGKKTCFLFEECEAVVCKLIKLKKYKDESLACAYSCAQLFLEALINNVINYCEGVHVEVLPFVDEKSEDKKGKKGGKAKKSETVRYQKSSKIASSKHSAGSVIQPSPVGTKSTFICPPCEHLQPEEKSIEKEEMLVEEEEPASPQEDPDVAYAVSQDVIWNVLRICLPWHFEFFPEEKMTPFVDMVQDIMKRLEGNHETGDIYVSMFVMDQNFCRFLHKVKKFMALNLAQEVRKVCI